MTRLLNFCDDARGATAIEYALIASIASIVIISGLSLMNGSVVAMYATIRDAMAGVVGG